MKKIISLLSLLLLCFTTLLVSAESKESKNTNSPAFIKLEKRNKKLAAYTQQLADLEKTIANSKSPDSSAINTKIAAIKDKIEKTTIKRNADRANLSVKDLVTQHPYITFLAVSSVVLVLTAIYNRKAISPAVVKAMAWMKANPTTSMSIIAAIVLISGAGFVWYNTEDDKGIWTITKNSLKAIPSNIVGGFVTVKDWSIKHPIVTTTTFIGLVVALAVTIDLSRKDSYLKNLVSGIYSDVTNETVIA